MTVGALILGSSSKASQGSIGSSVGFRTGHAQTCGTISPPTIDMEIARFRQRRDQRSDDRFTSDMESLAAGMNECSASSCANR